MLGLNGIDIAIVLAYFAATIGIGVWSSRRTVKTSDDYFMGGRRLGNTLMVAQAFGAGTRTDQVVAVVGASYQLGLAGIWYQWLYIFATPFFWLIAPIYRRLRYTTIADFFERRYSGSLAFVYTIAALGYFAIEIGMVLKGTATTISAITDYALPAQAVVLGMVVFFLSYSLLGGLIAGANSKLIQGLMILILSFMLIPFALTKAGGIDAVRQKLDASMFSLVAPNEVTLFFIVMAVINGLVGIVVYPHHMAINGAGKDELACRRGWTFGTFIKRFATLGWAFTGVFLAAIFTDLPNREAAFGVAVKSLLPTGFIGLMLAAMIAAVVAACDAYMVAGSALFTKNIIQKHFKPNASEQETLTMARLGSFLVVALGVAAALLLPSVVEGLKLVWQLMAFLGIAFWCGVVWRRANSIGAWTSVVVTASLALITKSLGWSLEYQALLYLPAGFLSLIVASALTKPESDTQLNEFYTLLHTPIGQEQAVVMPHTDLVKHSQVTQKSHDPHGNALLIVDLLSLRQRFSVARYKVDLQGLGYGSLAVVGILLLAFVLAKTI
jgi:Na+/proline symporter